MVVRTGGSELIKVHVVATSGILLVLFALVVLLGNYTCERTGSGTNQKMMMMMMMTMMMMMMMDLQTQLGLR